MSCVLYVHTICLFRLLYPLRDGMSFFIKPFESFPPHTCAYVHKCIMYVRVNFSVWYFVIHYFYVCVVSFLVSNTCAHPDAFILAQVVSASTTRNYGSRCNFVVSIKRTFHGALFLTILRMNLFFFSFLSLKKFSSDCFARHGHCVFRQKKKYKFIAHFKPIVLYYIWKHNTYIFIL